jgi:hypothetical protein
MRRFYEAMDRRRELSTSTQIELSAFAQPLRQRELTVCVLSLWRMIPAATSIARTKSRRRPMERFHVRLGNAYWTSVRGKEDSDLVNQHRRPVMSKEIKTLAIATILAASASTALAQSPPQYGNYYGGYGGPPPVGYNYGYGNYGYQGGYLGPTTSENAAAQDAWLAQHPRALRALRRNYGRAR